MKFIHAADLHLESPFEGLKSDYIPNDLWEYIYNSTFIAFEKLVQNSIEEKVDFILLAGDLFDRDTQTPKTYEFFYNQLLKLNEQNIKVFIIFGNHDYLNIDNNQLDFPNNVYVFGNEVETTTFDLDGEKIAITGFSYSNRWINEKMINKYPLKQDVDFQIGMLHGSEENTGDNYAPFNLQELISKNYNYWALGHIHKRMKLNDNPPIMYSGNIQGRHKKESGPKGYLLVNEKNNQLDISFEETSVIIWDALKIKLTQDDFDTIITDLMNKLYKLNYPKMHLLQLELKVDNYQHIINQDELLIRIQNTLKKEYQNLNVWIYDIKVIVNKKIVSQIDDEIWQKAAKDTFNNDQVSNLAQSLNKYDFIQKHLSDDIPNILYQESQIKILGNKDEDNEN
ncbi:DNA repair exonuclease [Apilactobacillus apisilvae]|uniref:DNA repair exonuclease n=1 Tax=Apilactobacillus apisilvae TaxID=2923364 RepID=A0ABY4PHG5_9LACO|nr:DNA repair exonuclease [Apilactobacillus apisilvae]UQS85249.1 DNA repair exonuclease [Apilactobacillus apisilvae]